MPAVASRAQDVEQRLIEELLAASREEPLEDGMAHPAEAILDSILRLPPECGMPAKLHELATSDADPTVASSVLCCLARRDRPVATAWRVRLVRDALRCESVAIRDAAVQASELWADRELIAVLTAHRESVGWLQDYVQSVVDGLAD